MLSVTENLKLKLTQNDTHSDSFQKYHGQITGTPIARSANNGTYNLKNVKY